MAPELRPEKRFFQRRLQLSIRKIEGALKSVYVVRRLSPAEKEGLLQDADFAIAWKVDHGRAPGAPSLIVAVSRDFPATLPQIFLPDSNEWFLKIPHVDKRGTLCVLPSHAVIDQFNCGAAVLEMVERGITLLEEGFSGSNQEEFVLEAEGYWTQIKEPPDLIATCEMSGTSRWLKGASIKHLKHVVVAGNDEELRSWVTQLTGSKPRRSFDVAFIWCELPVLPAGYPANNADLFRLIAEAGLADPATAAILARRSPLFVILAFETGAGIAAIASSVRGFDKPIQGYRPKSITGEMLATRWGHLRCGKHIVDRASPQWLHWRGGADEQREQIANANVMVVGCGAVGADVAMLLAKSGVRRFTLVDRETLKWENIGRHMLGAQWVGRTKAGALSQSITRHFPHVETTLSFNGIERICREHGAILADFDLIVCMTADWMGESALNLWARQFAAKAVIHGWLEPHGLAGHALLVAGNGGCLACGRNESGIPRDAVIEWATEPIMKIPACGGWFTPYGAIDSGPAKEMIAQLALDTLTGSIRDSTHRVFIGDHQRINNQGGTVREPWRSFGGTASFLNRTITRPWPANPQCPLCNRQ